MVNKVTLVGHLGRDPEIRSTASGRAVGNFSLATNRKWKDQQGNLQEETEWHQIVVWGRQAEIAGEYLTRGKLVYIEGRLQTRSWEDKETQEKRFKTEVVCDHFQMLGAKGEGEPGGRAASAEANGYRGSNQGGAPQGGSGNGGNFGGAGDDDISY